MIIGIIAVAFMSEYFDASLGMGYGTTLTPILLLFGFKPLQIVPAVILSQFVSGIIAASLHHRLGNVDFSRDEKYIKIAFIIAAGGIVAAVMSVLVAVSLPQIILEIYIGSLVLIIGVVILLTLENHYRFSWSKIFGLGVVAGINKGISGGGYGPIVTGGQILCGMDEKNAVSITALSESLVCIVATIGYIFIASETSWVLTPYLLIGSVLAAPLSVLTVKKIKTKRLKTLIGVVTITLGLATLIRVLL